MNPGQTSIPHGGPVYEGPCDWCGCKPAEPYEIEKARHTTAANGVRVVKRHPTMVMVCAEHRRVFDDQKARAEEEKAKARAKK